MICKGAHCRTGLRLTTFSLLFTVGLYATQPTISQHEGASQVQSKLRLACSISGSKGHEQGGRFVIDDARTVFKVPDDRQVLVYCEWEGSVGAPGIVGQHEFEGLWKNPADKVVAVSDFRLEVRANRCAGFFTLLLSETTETGLWTLEARVDGGITGQHKFLDISFASFPFLPSPFPICQEILSARTT